jgi:hypothetical protein
VAGIKTAEMSVVDKSQEQDATVGVAVICPSQQIFQDGICLESDQENQEVNREQISNGQVVKVFNNNIKDGTIIFTSFEDNPGTYNWIEKTKGEQGEVEGFEIHLVQPVKKPVKVNWWLVQKEQ